MGSLYKRGKTWWLKYNHNGRCFRESSGTTKKMVAKKLLDRKEGEIAQGNMPGVLFDKVTFDELAGGYLRDYRINQKKSLVRAKISVNQLKKQFKGLKVTLIGSPMINSYVADRMTAGASNGTINRELSALKRMFNLAAKQTPPLVNRVPFIPMLKENNTRKGFLEHDEFLALREALPSEIWLDLEYQKGWP
jgi:hypothetical protein